LVKNGITLFDIRYSIFNIQYAVRSIAEANQDPGPIPRIYFFCANTKKYKLFFKVPCHKPKAKKRAAQFLCGHFESERVHSATTLFAPGKGRKAAGETNFTATKKVE